MKAYEYSEDGIWFTLHGFDVSEQAYRYTITDGETPETVYIQDMKELREKVVDYRAKHVNNFSSI